MTAFSEVALSCKLQQSLMSNVDSTLRKIGQWMYLAVTDLTKAFYQIPLARDSMKYCGVVPLFRAVRVYMYQRLSIGMPWSETALEEIRCRVLGDLHEEGIVVKLADDLCCEADAAKQLMVNFVKGYSRLNRCDLKLAPPKLLLHHVRRQFFGRI